jgi:hypothetical protein
VADSTHERDLLEITKTLHAALQQHSQAPRTNPYLAGGISLVVALIMGAISGIYTAGQAANGLQTLDKLLHRHEASASHAGQALMNRELWKAINSCESQWAILRDDIDDLENDVKQIQGGNRR